jgi:hypothetical protein
MDSHHKVCHVSPVQSVTSISTCMWCSEAPSHRIYCEEALWQEIKTTGKPRLSGICYWKQICIIPPVGTSCTKKLLLMTTCICRCWSCGIMHIIHSTCTSSVSDYSVMRPCSACLEEAMEPDHLENRNSTWWMSLRGEVQKWMCGVELHAKQWTGFLALVRKKSLECLTF